MGDVSHPNLAPRNLDPLLPGPKFLARFLILEEIRATNLFWKLVVRMGSLGDIDLEIVAPASK